MVAQAVAGARIVRAEAPAQHAIYMSAAVSAAFLRTPEGKRLLADADVASRDLTRRALECHNLEAPRTILQYGWAMIRKLFPSGPTALKYWGRPKHQPPKDAPSMSSS